jgi:cystathionine beta-lyase/cystathionine gamma-synthase
MSHASIPDSLKDRMAPSADLVRISIGIEDVEDLTAELNRALTTSVRDPASLLTQKA